MSELKYRKLPVEVEAFKLGEAWPDWWADAVTANKAKTYNQDDRWRGGPDYALIQTLEGEMRAEKGDWIIRGVKGEVYPCKPDIFALTYEPATRPAPERHNELREALQGARDVIVTACGETAPYIKIALARIDAALTEQAAPVATEKGNG